MARVFVLDNYDSFTWNLVQEMGQLGAEPTVRRNDEVTVDEIRELAPEGIVISPGPGRPEAAGVSCEIVERLGGEVPILGVCLGHQAIGVAFGASIERAPTIMHGKVSDVHHDGRGIFEGISSPLVATRYHSLVIDRATLPAELVVTSETADGVVMGVRHRELAIEGVQFHPESVLTADGLSLLGNFLSSLGSPGRGGRDRDGRGPSPARSARSTAR
jgi:anthranilate synthase/aminodeoxychorismate synthase-like glutamine amidotransferase